MTPLAPIMLFGWVPFTILLFFRLPPQRAVLVAVIGGWLLLPMAGYNVPGIPQFDKISAISIGLILGGWLSGQRFRTGVSWKLYDLPMLVACVSPLATSVANDLGFYDGVSGIWTNTMAYGIPYLAGRLYFSDMDKLRDLWMGLVFGGLLYMPLCLYEIRMSPQLHQSIYGFFQSAWIQHFRYDGFRPIVFMQHGLMVSLWMALTTTAVFWLWRIKLLRTIKGIPMGLLTAVMVVTTILCKSANGWIALLIGCGSFLVYRATRSVTIFLILLAVFPLYTVLRINGFVQAEHITTQVEKVFDTERVFSLKIRLIQEDLFIEKALERPLLGWGRMGRAWPTDLETGQQLIQMIDAAWLIIFSNRGLLGLVATSGMMLVGPWLTLRVLRKSEPCNDFEGTGLLLLSLIVVLYMIDSLANGMRNPVYILISGVLVRYSCGILALHRHHLKEKTV